MLTRTRASLGNREASQASLLQKKRLIENVGFDGKEKMLQITFNSPELIHIPEAESARRPRRHPAARGEAGRAR